MREVLFAKQIYENGHKLMGTEAIERGVAENNRFINDVTDAIKNLIGKPRLKKSINKIDEEKNSLKIVDERQDDES